MVKYVFHPEGTVPITELAYALIGKQLGRIWRPSPPKQGTRPKTDQSIVAAWQECQRQMLKDLTSGNLIAHTYEEGTLPPLRIKALYWDEDTSGLSLTGKLMDLQAGLTFPSKLQGQIVYVLSENAIPWFLQQNISDTDPNFPDELRPQKSAVLPGTKARTRRDSAVKKAFIAEGIRILEARGGWSPEYKQVQLVSALLNWSARRWDEESAESTVKNYVREIKKLFDSNSTEER